MRLPPLDPATGRDLRSPDVVWLLPRSVVPPLPAYARRFLRTIEARRVRLVVLDLHRWLIFKRIGLERLTRCRVARFVERPSRGDELGPEDRRRYAAKLAVYLRWLWRHRLLAFDPTPRRHAPYPLPPLAQEFLASLRPTLRPSTCEHYASSLCRLHQWLDRRGLALARLSRRRFAPWLLHLHACQLAPSTRLSKLFNVRAYLRWLAERRVLRAHPDDLIRRTDLPKLPTYLPRPLPPDIDRELQRRLAATDDEYARGLLLMRRTGLRVGELLRLERECLRTDSTGHWYLKVPLGKLYTERLVPLDEDTVALVHRLQAAGDPRRSVLLAASSTLRAASYPRCCQALRAACVNLHDAAPITSHRLRHTYATELLNAGMSLVGVMRLLGHRDYRMTLRYAAITQETIGKEYYRALEHLAEKYRLPAPQTDATQPDPRAILDDLARWLRHRTLAPPRLHALLGRITRLRDDLEDLATPPVELPRV